MPDRRLYVTDQTVTGSSCDLSDELTVKSQLVIPFTKTFQIMPFVKAFFCKGEMADVVYSNVTTGLAVNFNRLYKYR